MTSQHWLIIANGEPLKKADTKTLAKGKRVIALDGAFNTCIEYGIVPDICIGDFDSIDETKIDKAKEHHTTEFIHITSQDSTDLEKGLNYAYKHGAQHVTICHATGWRLDHSLYNLRLLKRFHGTFKSLMMITKLEKIFFIKDQSIQLSGAIDDAVALLSFPKAVVTSSGLTYDMNQYELKHGISESTSNSLAQQQASIRVEGEALLLISQAVAATICNLSPSKKPAKSKEI